MISVQEAAELTKIEQEKQNLEKKKKEQEDQVNYKTKFDKVLQSYRENVDRDIKEAAIKGKNSICLYFFSRDQAWRDALYAIIEELRVMNYKIKFDKAKFSDDSQEEEYVVVSW